MRIGVDLGGTKIEGLVLDDRGGEVARDRVPTPAGDYEAVLDAIISLVGRLQAWAGARVGPLPSGTGAHASVGVATPGFLSPRDGTIRNANLTVLNGRAIDRDLTRKLGQPVRVANDANCFALSEATDGAAVAAPVENGAHVVFAATLGTGVGGGLVVNGRIWGGANGSAGEWSHDSAVLARGRRLRRPCFCGRVSCIESFLSGRALTWDHERLTGDSVPSVELGARAAQGEAPAVTTFARYEDRLARALAGVVNLLDPTVIVLGGGISNNVRLFENVPRVWELYTVSNRLSTRLVRAAHGDASGVRGAAWLWPRDEDGSADNMRR